MSKVFKTIILQQILFTSVSAATFYVSPAGNSSNKGTSEKMPFQVVQFAIDQMKEGDTLTVLDGFYTGTLHLKSGITIRAKNLRRVVFSGAVLVLNASGAFPITRNTFFNISSDAIRITLGRNNNKEAVNIRTSFGNRRKWGC